MTNHARALRDFCKYTLAIASFALVASAKAMSQDVLMPPVARLLAEPSSVAATRPRLVGPTVGSPKSPDLTEANTIERTAFEKTNEARVNEGLNALVWDAELCRMARAHSEDMARQGYFAHETPDGLHLKERARSLGIAHFRVIAENIAYNKGYADPGAFAVERWMNSGGHRANMLYAVFQASAIGSYVASDGSVYLTQVFITR